MNLIERAGQALWGDRWQTEMARAIKVNKDTVQDWRQGRSTPRSGVYVDLLRVANERSGQIKDLLHALEIASRDAR